MTVLMKLADRLDEAPDMTDDRHAQPRSFTTAPHDRAYRAKWWTGRVAIYGAADPLGLHLPVPDLLDADHQLQDGPGRDEGQHGRPGSTSRPKWLGWRSLGLSPDTWGDESTVRAEFLKRFSNSAIVSLVSSVLAVVLGSLAAYGLRRFSYKFGWMRNDDISFFFLSQLILPPVVLALPFLVLYKELALLDTRIGLILLYTLSVLPIVIWIMRDQFASIPTELEEAALVDGLSIWGAFVTIILPIALPGMVAAFILSPRADLERVLLRGPADLDPCQHPAGDGGQPDRQSRASAGGRWRRCPLRRSCR